MYLQTWFKYDAFYANTLYLKKLNIMVVTNK